MEAELQVVPHMAAEAENKLEVGEAFHSETSPPRPSDILQQGCTTLTRPTSVTDWGSTIQMPKTTEDISHSNHHKYQINIQKLIIVL